MGAITESYYPIRRPINLNELDGYREDVYQHLLEMGEKGGWLTADYLERQIRDVFSLKKGFLCLKSVNWHC